MTDSTINPLNNYSTSNIGNTSGASSTTTDKQNNASSIDEEGFLQLFIEGLKNQDPMSPMSNTEMMGQLTQLTEIQNTMNMKSILQDLASSIQSQNPVGQFLDLIDKTVKVQVGENETKEGQVLSVGKDGNDVVFELMNGDTYNVNQIIGVTEA
ncbi:flagellar hook capping FlgD N-terminal domain-containing protein [Priestia megaterium]|uniref:flagellar hook capping FlgD N-terminal domain-containing protein n=1 Tax=Priestia megaterium TaxID=1404 RepID=UPI0031010744